MPGKKSYKKSFKKKTYRKKTFRKAVIPTAPANHSVVKLKYTENISMSSTLGGVNFALWRINDLYDPSYSTIGHQAYFRDQMFALYSNARVLWASIKITIICTNSSPFHVCLGPIQSGTPDTDIQTASERKGSKELYITNQVVKSMKCQSSSDYYFGMSKKATLYDPELRQISGSSIGTAVNKSMWYQIIMKTIDNTSNGLYFKVDVDQIVRFEEPIQQVGS